MGYRTSSALAIAGMLLTSLWLGGGCDSAIEITDAAPRITWIAIQPPTSGEGIAEVTVWISDLEGDAVDLDVRFVTGGVASELVLEPGSHHLRGLTTKEARFDPNGQPHILVWNVTALSSDMSGYLCLRADDQRGGQAGPWRTEEFTIGAGVPSAVQVVDAGGDCSF